MHRTIFCVAVFCALSFVAFGSVSAQPVTFYDGDAMFLTHEGVPTPNRDGHTTWTIQVHSKSTAQIQGFDLFGTAATPFGFFGPLNQVNPFGTTPTFWTDNNNAITGTGFNVQEDTQFLFNSGELIVIPGSASESSMHLRAAAASGTALGTSVDLAQLVIPNGAAATVEVMGSIAFSPNAGIPAEVFSGVIPVPEPTAMALACFAMVGLCAGYRRRS